MKVKRPGGLKKYRAGYAVGWTCSGSFEVEAGSAMEADSAARKELDGMIANGEFDSPSGFAAKYDGAHVTGVGEIVKVDDAGGCVPAGKNEDERRYALQIAALTWKKLDGIAAKAVAEAVVNCKAHPVAFLGDGEISFDYDNSFGPTHTVDNVLERMNMRDWRMACDEFCKLMLWKGGLDPEDFDWPTPLPEVTKVPEDGGTDVISRVCVAFRVDERTYDAILAVEAARDNEPAVGEEICSHCDHVIRYVCEKGKRIVTCPECGAVNPLCNECDPDSKRCAECEVSAKCGEINKLLADACGKEE